MWKICQSVLKNVLKYVETIVNQTENIFRTAKNNL